MIHRGRRSGREYRTPVNVFRRDGTYVIALTYGTESDWVKNVLTAGGCHLETRGRRYELRDPRIYRDEDRTGMPSVVRAALHAIKAYDFLAMDVERPVPQ